MSSLIRAKGFATHTGSPISLEEFAVLVYKHGLNYDRIDLVFDQYFEKSLKERTRSGSEEGPQYLFEGDFTDISYKMTDSFLKNNQSKNKLDEYLSLKLLKPQQGDQVMIAACRNTSLSSPFSYSELDIQVLFRWSASSANLKKQTNA